MTLWDWAREVYGRPGVEAACLALQDDHGQCVPFLLWRLWAGRDGGIPGPEALERAVVIARLWDHSVIQPLRAARRGLKAAAPGIADPGREALRTRVKADELQAERLLLEALEAVDPGLSGGPTDVLASLVAGSAAWSAHAAPISALDRLARSFSGH